MSVRFELIGQDIYLVVGLDKVQISLDDARRLRSQLTGMIVCRDQIEFAARCAS